LLIGLRFLKRYNEAERKILSIEGFEAQLLAILLSSREGIELNLEYNK
jgi:hypothetical protein